MLRSIVVDDELKSREVIKTLVENFCPEVEIVGMAEDIVGAIAAIESLQPNLVFLDITLKEGDSFQILQALDEINFEIIFVTAYDEYSVKAINYSGITCLFKPIDIDELQQAVKQIAKSKTNMTTAYQMVNGILKSKFTKIPVITKAGLVFTSIKNITYITASDTGSTIHFVDNEKVESKRNITEFEDVILSNKFQRLDNKTLINSAQLKPIQGKRNQLEFMNGVTIAGDSNMVSRNSSTT
ncbi:MAG: response regulator transcription factor [Bacteroidetes bacterium]|jgi:two-component system, LytTR family, response regulator|nr:response regulator transcription factor [Bacteroidota bacterium]